MIGFPIDNVERTGSAVTYLIITELGIFRPEKEELGNKRKEKIT
jgi:acyl CoA:acetate/3-ketoacid CoA transferase beta subunit